MSHLYLGQWQWTTEGSNSFWQMPRADIGLGCLDLRSLPQQALAGGAPQGYGLFVLSAQDPSVGYYLGDALAKVLNNAQKKALTDRLGLSSGSLSVADILGILWELLTTHADPTGQTRWKPLMPTMQGKLELHLGGFSLIKSEPYSPVQHPLVLEVVKQDFTRLRQENLARESQHYRKVLDALVQKYKVPWQELSSEPPLPHETTITDNFTRADADALGTSSEGWSWTETQGDIDIVSNRAEKGSLAVHSARADSDLSTDDMYSQAIGTLVATDQSGVATRFAAAATTYYGFWARANASTTYRLVKCVTGTQTVLQGVSTTAAVSGSVLKFSADGSALEGLDDGASVITVTDTAITGNVRAGLYGSTAAANQLIAWDDFQAADLSAGATFVPKIMLFS